MKYLNKIKKLILCDNGKNCTPSVPVNLYKDLIYTTSLCTKCNTLVRDTKKQSIKKNYFIPLGYSYNLKRWVYFRKILFLNVYILKIQGLNDKRKITLKPIKNIVKGPYKTYVYYTEEELRKEYSSKWEIPTNEDWKFLREGKEITFRELKL